MRWLPIFKRVPAGNQRNAAPGRSRRDSVAATADTVQQARTRARRRLIGAAVLVVAGVIGFPLLFETQPRPVPVDIPIEIPRKDGSPALAMPTVRAPQVAATASAPPGMIIESSQDAGREVPPPVVTPSRSTTTVAAAKPAIAASHTPPVARAVPTPTQQSTQQPTRVVDAGRAAALLDGKPVVKVESSVTKPPSSTASTAASTSASPASPASGPARFIVQAGAFIDAAAARDTRAKLEHLGLKTYTQVADTPSGPRVRVRLGPFANRAEADKALAKAKAAGLAAVVITL